VNLPLHPIPEMNTVFSGATPNSGMNDWTAAKIA
jgi:hypothetical protein